MRRRKLLGLAGISLTGSAVIGTSAFNVSRADRTITVGVEEDYDAYLQLEDLGEGERSEIDGGQLELNIPGDDEDDYNSLGPQGIGADSVYWFGRDAGDETNGGLFKITNQGKNAIKIFSSQLKNTGIPSITIFKVESEEVLTEGNPSSSIGVGDSIRCGIRIDTDDVEIQEAAYDVTLTINAEATAD